MRKFLFAALTVLLGLALYAPPALAGSGTVPPQSHAFGNSRVDWMKAYTQWTFGDASNPITQPECGTIIDGAYFMNTPVAASTEYECDIPTGVPIVFVHAAYFAWVPTDGANAEQIEATAETLFAYGQSMVTLDGKRVPLTTTATGAFDVDSEPGSAYDTIFGLGTGSVLTAVVGQITILHPLPPGKHTIFAFVDFTPAGGPQFDVTYHLQVG